jgi:hypothetical protein
MANGIETSHLLRLWHIMKVNIVMNDGNTMYFSCIPRWFKTPRRKGDNSTGQSALPIFFMKEFNGTFEDMCCINIALLFDPTIKIVGCPLCANEVPGFKKPFFRQRMLLSFGQ